MVENVEWTIWHTKCGFGKNKKKKKLNKVGSFMSNIYIERIINKYNKRLATLKMYKSWKYIADDKVLWWFPI